MDETQRRKEFERVAMPHLDAAYNLARWLCGNAHDAEDVTQEAFMRALRFFDGFQGGDARTWLLKIVRNTCYSRWRRTKLRAEPLAFDEELHSPLDESGEAGPAMESDPEAALLRGEQIRLLDRAMESLPHDFREALVLRELEDLSYKEIAESLEIPIGTVMSRLARARRLLLVAYKQLAGEDHGVQASPRAARRVR